MGLRGELFSTRVILQNRTYFFNVKENRVGDLYLNIVESKNRDEGGFDRQSVILFAEDLQEFLKGFDESLRIMEKEVRERRREKRTVTHNSKIDGKSDREDRGAERGKYHNADDRNERRGRYPNAENKKSDYAERPRKGRPSQEGRRPQDGRPHHEGRHPQEGRPPQRGRRVVVKKGNRE
ncbi:MAG: DUF3276 family protein [Treponema sp.]|jgi:hypothetical protein|nr:DUF3276 family protein [Treponema sp.]